MAEQSGSAQVQTTVLVKLTKLAQKLPLSLPAGFPSAWWIGIRQMDGSQKIAAIGIAITGTMLVLANRWCRRKRVCLDSNRSLRAVRRARQVSLSRHGSNPPSADSTLRRGSTLHQSLSAAPGVPAGGGAASLVSSGPPSYNWSELQKASASGLARGITSDKDSIASEATLVDGTPLSPQQLGLMGMEALETVIGYWEDALQAYQPAQGRPNNYLTTAEETRFIKLLENILEGVYQLQEESESLFIHQNSLLNKDISKYRQPKPALESNSSVFLPHGADGAGSKNNLLSVSSADSFVSAQDTIADLRDFDDLVDDSDPMMELYVRALALLEKDKDTGAPTTSETCGIPYRTIRTEFVGCHSDADYLAKLHCLRIAFKEIMSRENDRLWWINSGKAILSALLQRADKDTKAFSAAYEDLVSHLSDPVNVTLMGEELESRNVRCINFYDVALDYLLIDSFEDLEAPPSSVLAVMRNRWLSDGFKESALSTAIWSVLKAKRRLLHQPNGFKAKFYNLSEILTPVLAWGFFGPDETLSSLMNYFKEQVLSFIRDLYSFEHVRYTNVAELSQDVMTLAKARLESGLEKIQTHEPE